MKKVNKIRLIIYGGVLLLLLYMLVPRPFCSVRKARMAKARREVFAVSIELEYYKQENGKYPTAEQGWEALLRTLRKSFPEKYPKFYLVDPWGNKYQYRSPSIYKQGGFDVYSFGPDGVSSDDDIGNWQEWYKKYKDLK
ncbi:MAG: type II secretion system protein GspG [Planctomycetes bacterium]|nr:type II secretion system protein GspG [Planctomycetota bacterium]